MSTPRYCNISYAACTSALPTPMAMEAVCNGPGSRHLTRTETFPPVFGRASKRKSLPCVNTGSGPGSGCGGVCCSGGGTANTPKTRAGAPAEYRSKRAAGVLPPSGILRSRTGALVKNAPPSCGALAAGNLILPPAISRGKRLWPPGFVSGGLSAPRDPLQTGGSPQPVMSGKCASRAGAPEET